MQVSVEEAREILEPEAHHSIKPYMRKPYKGHRQEEGASSHDAQGREQARWGVGVEEVVGDRSYPRPAQVP